MPSPSSAGLRPPGRSGTAGGLLLERLATQRDALREAAIAIRAGDPEGVHDLRVATRRIRSALATFRPLVDSAVTEPVRDQLRWAAEGLGHARDAEIIVGRVTRRLDDDPGVVVGHAARREVLTAVTSLATDTRAHVEEVVGSSRYAAVMDAVDDLVRGLPITAEAARSADDVALEQARREADRLWHRAAVAQKEPDAARREPLLHEVRKVAKRLRYAAEAGVPYDATGWLERVAVAAADVQTVLGDHHDAAVTAAAMRTVGNRTEDPAVAMGCGQIAALEAIEAARLEAAAGEALDRLRALTVS
jgi:CHAD domain-containing protein